MCEASDPIDNVERAAGLKHQQQAVFGLWDNLSAQGDVPAPGSVIEEMLEVSVEAVQIIPQEHVSDCIAEQKSRRLSIRRDFQNV